MKVQVLNPKCLMLLFVTVLLTYGAQGISYGQVCEAGDILAPGESCTYPGTDAEFTVHNNGNGQFLFFSSGNSLNIKNTVINGVSYTLVANKLASGSWEIEEIADSTAPTTTNTAPTFTEGASTTRTIAENTSGDVNIGAAVAATDPENDTLTYTLSGTDAASFNIESTTGQLKTSTALDYETKSTYTVTITVSDSDLTDTITVTINVSDIAETSTATTAVDIPDSNLRAKIETALGKASGDPISAAEMATLTSLSAQDAGISNLTGLETATNLTTLLLGNNSISNISAIAGLTKLTELQLWDNTISNISAVAGLTQLTRLYLWGNIITDISHISGLTNLTHLRLGENSVSNISAVAGLTKLTHLNLKENSVSNISAVAGLTDLTELVIGNNTISDIALVANLTKLVWLDMPNNTISDITPVTGLTNLIELYFEENSVSDLSPLVTNSGLGANTEIDVRGNPLNYPSIYTHIPALQARGAYVDFDNRVATAPVKISGDTQQSSSGTTLAQPFVVEVRDGDNAVFAGVPVTFAVTAGGGTLSVTSTTTDANGRAASTLTLGNTAGTNTVSVSVQGISQAAIFTAMATTTNTAPTFTDGASTTRSVAENTATGVNIGNAIAATDTDNDTLTYTLGGINAASFAIDGTTGQLKTSAALDYETKSTYTVTVTISDGTLTDSITVTINITDVAETPANTGVCQVGDVLAPGESCTYPGTDATFSVHNNGNGQFLFFTSSSNLNIKNTVINGQSYTLVANKLASGSWKIEEIADSAAPATTNTAPVFTEGASTTRTIAENTAAGVNIGTAVAATDADNDTLTYTLGGTDASAFDIDSTTGQLRTRATLDYETKRAYNVAVSVSDGTLTDSITVTINVTDIVDPPVVSTLIPVCDRTTQVRDAIVAAVPGVSDCNDVTEAHLAAITRLDLENKNISSLKDGDFDGMTALYELKLQNNRLQTLPANIFSDLSSLRTLYLNNNRLSSLPSTVFSGLSSLSNLYMNNNQLTSLPALVFSGLTSLRQINMHTNLLTTLPVNVFSGLSSLNQISINNNRLTSLPENVFSGRTGLIYLYLDGNRLTSLPANLFSGLSALEQLKFNNNRLSTLPAGLFRGLSSLTWLLVQGNTVNPLPFTVSLEKVGTNQFKATAPVGAPFAMTIPITVVNGSISGGATTLTIPAGDVESAPLTVTRTLGTTGAVTVDIGTLPGLPTQHQGYELVKSSNLPLTVINVLSNSAPVFTDGTSATRTIAENTASGVNIGSPVSATDANNDTLTYSLSGTDAASFDIDTTNGQLQTQAALDYETKSSYTVTVTVSDGDLTDTITVTVNITDINELPTDAGICQVGDILASGESCTYPGTDATFSVLDNGHARWNIPGLPSWLAWANQVSIGGSLSFTATINDEDYHFVAEEGTNDSWEIKEIGEDRPEQPETPETPEQPDDVGGTPTVTASTTAPLTETTLNGSIVTLTLSGATYHTNWNFVSRSVEVSGITGVRRYDVDRVSDTEVTVELKFNGNINADSTLTFTVGADAIANYNGPAFTAQVPVSANTESLIATTAAPLIEATLNGSIITLTLSGATYHTNWNFVSRSVEVSGITGVRQYHVDRVSDTEVTVELEFNGNINADSTLTFTVGADAIANYNGPPLTAQLRVSSSTESLIATTAAPLTEATLDGNVVTLRVTGGTYKDNWNFVNRNVKVSGIAGVTFSPFNLDIESDTEITVELDFDGTDFDANSTLTFTVEPEAMVNYTGPALTAQISVTALTESVVATTAAPLTEATLDESVVTLTLSGRTYERSIFTIRDAVTVSGIAGVTVGTSDIDRVSDTQVTVELTFNGNINTDSTLTFTVGADAIAVYTGPALTAQVSVSAGDPPVVQVPDTPEQPITTGGEGETPRLSASTAAPLTEATLHEGVVTLRLSGGTYERSTFTIRDAVTLSGIAGVTVGTFGVDRVSDTEVTIELEFDGNINTNATLIFTVGAAAIVDYTGPAFTAQIPVTANTESVVATTVSPLTETTLDESIVTLTLNGAKYAESIFDIRDAVTVSGIAGVTKPWHQPERKSDTKVTVELEFDGMSFDTTSTLTFTVEADAIAGYNGPALTAQISVSAVAESVVASTTTPLTEATLDESIVTLTLSGRNYARSIWNIRGAVTVSGIAGVTVGTFGVDRVSDTEVTIELEFNGNIDTDAALTFTVGADAIAGYNGSALTAQVPVTATQQVLRAPSGISLIHVPLRVTAVDGAAKTIESVGDLYDALGGMNTVNLLITYDPKTQGWRSYLGEASRGTSADTVLTNNQGIIADMKTPASLQLEGDTLGSNGSSFITLHPGTNLLGMPLQDSRITRVSDLFALEGIGGNVSTITVSNNGTFQMVKQAGDVGDIPITGGQSFILTAREATTVTISGQGWHNNPEMAAAAPVALTGIQVGDTTPVLALTGSIVPPVGEWGRIPHLRLGSGLRVIVKNLSTGSAVATMTGDEGGRYQLTVVDTETGRAAQIGDILEISVRSPDRRIGVQPLHHTVTAENVKRSRVELGNLIVYEIPTETELLPNYPNPFNPETWIPYRLAEDAFVTLTIYDTAGRVVRSIDVGYKPAAAYESRSKAIYWDGRNEFGEQVASSVYFYHLSASDFSATRKMLIIK